MHVSNKYQPQGYYSLDSFYASSSIHESRGENRSALILSVAIVTVLLSLITFGGGGHQNPDVPIPHPATQAQ